MKTGWLVAAIGALVALLAAVALVVLINTGTVSIAIHWPGQAGSAGGKDSASATASDTLVSGAPGSAPGEGRIPAAPSPGPTSSPLPATVPAIGDSVTPADMSTRIMAPPVGSPLSTALLMAAKRRLGTTWRFDVNQLYVLGRSAVGDITNKDGGGRFFVAWGSDGSAVWSAAFGSSKANASSAAAALPGFSKQLLGAIDWHLSSPSQQAALKSSVSSAASAQLGKDRGGAGEPYRATSIRIAFGSDGSAWARVVLQTTAKGVKPSEAIELWAHRKSGSWVVSTQSAALPAPTTYFPKSVASALFP